MNANDTIRTIIKKSGKTQKDLAEQMGISKRTLDTKLYRGGFYTQELIQIADFLKLKLAFIDENQKIVFELDNTKSEAVATEAKPIKRQHISTKERLKDYYGDYKTEEWDIGEPVGNEVF